MKYFIQKITRIILSPLVRISPEDNVYRTDYFGKIWYIPYPKRWMALWAKDFMTTHVRFENILTAGDIVIEVGACTGEYTVPIAELIGHTGHIYTFEADPLSHKCLIKNVTLYEVQASTTIEHLAVSNEEGKELILYHQPKSIASSSFHRSKEGKQPFSIQTVTLDAFFAGRFDQRRIALLKLTVNEHEPEIIAGALKLLENVNYVIFQSTRHAETTSILQDLNFKTYVKLSLL